jgi:hypothetical protein
MQEEKGWRTVLVRGRSNQLWPPIAIDIDE